MIQGNTLSYSTSIEKACSEKQRESKIQLHDSHSGKNREWKGKYYTYSIIVEKFKRKQYKKGHL